MEISKQDSNTQLSLGRNNEDDSIKQLVPLLANELFMYSLYKKYHWHVEGEDFYQYHLLFDKHADEHLPLADLLAERIRTLGGRAPGMPEEVVKNKTLEEPAEPGSDGQKMVQNLCKVHEAAIALLRKAAKTTDENDDAGTNDIVVSDVLRLHELQLWFIRSSKRG